MMSGKWKNPFLFIISFFIVLLIVLICPSYQQASSQIPGGIPPSQTQLESIKIINLTPFQKVDLNKELAISGESSDSIAKDCSVYIIVNGVQPYQNAVASGTGGAKDYSQWKFVLHEQYTHLKDGNNKITAKLLCASAPARWYSVVVNGVRTSNASEAISPVQSNQQQSNASEANNTNNRLIVTITSQKDPVARGDTQNSTIIVTDSSHRAIPNAQIDGKLIYPGNNFEKDFKGITDFEGKFAYSWIVGKKGDVGPLVMKVVVSSAGYPPASAENSFELVKSSESSEVKNPFQSHFQKP